jgi:hypothetical protein
MNDGLDRFQAIAALELDVRVTLLTRTTRGVSLTAADQTCATRARVISDVNATRTALRDEGSSLLTKRRHATTIHSPSDGTSPTKDVKPMVAALGKTVEPDYRCFERGSCRSSADASRAQMRPTARKAVWN